VFVNGPADLDAARRVQTGFHLMPLSAYYRTGSRIPTPPPVSSRHWPITRQSSCGCSITWFHR